MWTMFTDGIVASIMYPAVYSYYSAVSLYLSAVI